MWLKTNPEADSRLGWVIEMWSYSRQTLTLIPTPTLTPTMTPTMTPTLTITPTLTL